MNKALKALIAAAAVYGVVQVTLSPLLESKINAFGSELAATPENPDGTLGPIAVRSSDICTLLTQTGMWKGQMHRWAFLQAGSAADNLNLKYQFSPAPKCSKYNVPNYILARPK